MAKYNKTELDSQVDSVFVPTLTLASHKAFLKDSAGDSQEMKKRRVTTAAMTANTYALNFLDTEMYDIDCNARDMVFTVSNLSEGQEAYVKFTDFTGGSISFSNVTLCGGNQDNGNCVITPALNLYKIVNIRGTYFGYYVGKDPASAVTLDFDDLHKKTIEIRINVLNGWTNGPYAAGILNTVRITTTVSGVYNSNEYDTMYEVTIMDFGAGQVKKYIGNKVHTGAITWTQL